MTTSEKQTPEPSEVIRHIEGTRGLLFHLADKLTKTPKDQWNVLIGDDSGGRLPVHFVRRVLRSDGRDFKTFFVTGSKVYREANGVEPYQEYFTRIQEQLGGGSLRPLIVTESVGSGATIDFLTETIAPFCEQPVEVAAIAVEEAAKDKVDYAGGIGDEPIKEVGWAYESARKMKFGRRLLAAALRLMPQNIKDPIKKRSKFRVQPPLPNLTVGIAPELGNTLPVASLMAERDGVLARRAFEKMDELAEEYLLVKNNTSQG
ncbi:MAG: hypothetical protein ACM3JF_00840 [Sphaerimonospora mesophila]